MDSNLFPNLSLAGDYSNIIFGNNKEYTQQRTVLDCIHGHMKLDSYTWDYIDTIEFQRLRNLKQLGNAWYIFPGGTHTRFEHSLGVAHLSNRLCNLLCDYKEDMRYYAKPITLAGLCHDLGHGPFSHLFDRWVIKALRYVY